MARTHIMPNQYDYTGYMIMSILSNYIIDLTVVIAFMAVKLYKPSDNSIFMYVAIRFPSYVGTNQVYN